jgi:hypothetical protein
MDIVRGAVVDERSRDRQDDQPISAGDRVVYIIIAVIIIAVTGLLTMVLF